MFHPMLAFQTFESTSLTDMSSRAAAKPTRFTRIFKELTAIKKLEEWARDPITLQPWEHVFDEPLLQLGPKGVIITVERQFVVILLGTSLATALRSVGLWKLSNIFLGGTIAFFVGVRSTIALLMNWK